MKKVVTLLFLLVTSTSVWGQSLSRDILVGPDDGLDSHGSNVFCATNRYSTSEDKYYPEEIGCAGIINKISFYSLGNSYRYTISVYLSTGSNGRKTPVYSGSLNRSGGSWHSINITPYYYNGTEPLILTIVRNNVNYDNSITFPVYATYGYHGGYDRHYMVGDRSLMAQGSFGGINSNYIHSSTYKPVIKLEMNPDVFLYYIIKDSIGHQVGVSFRPMRNSIPISVDNDTVMVIPPIVDINGTDYNVVEVEKNAFSRKDYIQEISLPNTIQVIGDSAFYKCAGITGQITLPSTLASIGDYAFYGCIGVTGSMVFPSTLNSIGMYAFYGCTGLTGCLLIPDGVDSIKNATFKNCTSVSELILSDRLKYIGIHAFENDSNLFGQLNVPDSVYLIGHHAFAQCKGFSSLRIGNGLDSIGLNAFQNCIGIKYLYYNARGCTGNFGQGIDHRFYDMQDSVRTLVIGDSVRTIPNYTFSGFKLISAVTIPYSVTSIGSSAFYNCIGLDSLFIGSGVTTINQYAFENCRNVKYLYYNAKNCTGDFSTGSGYGFYDMRDSVRVLVIGDSVRTIPNYAFYGFKGISTLSIPSSVMSIGNYAFSECSNVSQLFYYARNLGTSADWYNADSYYDSYGFRPMTNIRSITIGDNIQELPAGLFYNSSNVSKIIIPDSVVLIGEYAFGGCSGLDSLFIGSGMTTIAQNAFQGCTNVRYLYYNARDLSTNSNWYNTSIDFSSYGFGSMAGLNTIEMGNSVQVLPAGVFFNKRELQYVNIAGSVTTIDDYAFGNCNNLLGVVIPNSVTNIGHHTFENCYNMTNLILPNSVTNIGDYAFYNCTSILGVVVPNSMTRIGNYVFAGCRSMTNLAIPNSITSIGNHAFEDCVSLPSLIIPSSVTIIGDYSFAGCSGMIGLTIPDTITSIGNHAFEGCVNLSSLSIPNSVTSIGDYAFSGCTNIQGSIHLPNSLTTLGARSFSNCDNILYLHTNNSPASIGDYAFANCDRLVGVTIGDSTPSIGNNAFEGCFRLSQVSVGNSVTSIGNSAFKDCVRLVNPLLPQSLTSIGSYAFDGCISIGGEITFPSQMQSIGDYAYRGIGTITAFNMKGMNSPSIASHTFESISDSIPVYIPCGSYMNYYTRNFWENFANLQEVAPYMISVSSADSLMGTARVVVSPTCSNAQARIQAIPLNNFHFTRWSDGATENPRYVLVTCDTHIVASFAPDIALLIVHSNDSTKGMVTGSGRYNYNSQVTMTATSIGANHFLKWTDGNRQNPRPVVVGCDTNYTAIFVSDISSITATSANPQMGTTGGSGIYYYQNQISLTASPNYGYHFTQWNDGNTSNPRNVVVEQDSSFTAFFALNIYSVSANSNNNSMGSVTGTGSYTYNTEMSMMATPAYGYHFEQWNDGNTNNPRTITVTRDSAFTAQFAANTYQITAVANDPNMGSAFGAGTYNYNTQITLTATAEYGYHFTQWSDGSTDNPRLVTVTNSANYTAMFEINSYTLTVNSSNPAIGTVSGGGSYNYLTPVNISANPNIGYHFTQWSDGNTDNPRLVSVTQNATYTAQFSINTYAISATSNNTVRGMVSGSGTYAHFSQDTLRATPFYGYHFTQWNDGNTDNPRIVVVTDVANYMAQFDPNNYLVMGNSTDMTIGVVVGSGTYAYQSQTALTAQPMLHYHFVQWTDSITDNPRTITVTRDTVLTAEFAIDQHSLTLISDNPAMGSTSNSTSIAYGGATYISATANYGYHFTQWSDGNTSNPRRIVVTQDTIFTAQFATNTYMATITVNDTLMGSVSGSGGYDYLTNVTLTASENYGYHFVQWNDGITNNPRQIRITQDTALVAQFSINQYQLTVHSSDSLMGGVSGTGNYDYLSQVAISATPLLHYHFVQWNDGNTSNPRMVNITSDVEYTALFEEDEKYRVSVVANDSTYGTVSGGGEYYIGAQITIRATAGNHYYFSEWSDGSSENPRVVTVIGNMTYTANFEPTPYLVTVTANDLSRGNVSGGGTYPYGSEVEISATAYPGFVFVKWYDGDSNATRNITVLDNCYYQAIFEADNTEGISDIEYDYSVRTANMQIIVDGVMGRKVEVYDISGRRIAYIDKSGDKMIANVPARGVYLIKVGDTPARKVVVM